MENLQERINKLAKNSEYRFKTDIVKNILSEFKNEFKKSNFEKAVLLDKKKHPVYTTYEKMSFKQTFLIGLSQCLAFIPGVSRSGITMTTGRAMGVDRESAARYSFMLSAPIVLAATIFKIKDFVFSLPFFVGVLASFIVGIIVIKWLLNYLHKGSFKGFAIYRVIFGLIILIVAFVR